jgi:hypothetical protein
MARFRISVNDVRLVFRRILLMLGRHAHVLRNPRRCGRVRGRRGSLLHSCHTNSYGEPKPAGMFHIGFVAFSRPQSGYIVVVAGSKLFRDKLAKFPVEKAARKISIAHGQDENAERTGHNDRRRHLWQPHTRCHVRSLRVPLQQQPVRATNSPQKERNIANRFRACLEKPAAFAMGKGASIHRQMDRTEYAGNTFTGRVHAYSAMPCPECSRCDDGILLRKRQ